MIQWPISTRDERIKSVRFGVNLQVKTIYHVTVSAAGVILTGFFVEDSFEAILRRVFQGVIFSSLINLKVLPLKEKYR